MISAPDSKQVLIVEDEVLVGIMLARMINGFGFTVTAVVGSGEEALQKAAAMPGGIAVMDVSLRGNLDGIDTAALLRARHRLEIIFFTGFCQDEQLLSRVAQVKPVAVLNKLGPDAALQAALAQAAALLEQQQPVSATSR